MGVGYNGVKYSSELLILGMRVEFYSIVWFPGRSPMFDVQQNTKAGQVVRSFGTFSRVESIPALQ